MPSIKKLSLKKKPQVIPATTDELIHHIESKDRRFRFAQTIFMVSALLGLIVVIAFQNQTLNGLKTQAAKDAETVKVQSEQSNNVQETILRRLDCLAVYFSQTSRGRLTITNINKCTLDRNGTALQFFTQEPGEEPETTTTEQTPPLQ